MHPDVKCIEYICTNCYDFSRTQYSPDGKVDLYQCGNLLNEPTSALMRIKEDGIVHDHVHGDGPATISQDQIPPSMLQRDECRPLEGMH